MHERAQLATALEAELAAWRLQGQAERLADRLAHPA
jgi:hypothetical protein